MFDLHNIDCFEYMRSMPDKCVDVTITDPPYNERTHAGAVTSTIERGGAPKEIINDVDFLPLSDHDRLVNKLLRVTKRWIVIFCALEDIYKFYQAASKVGAWMRAGVWDRVSPTPQFTGDRPAQAVEGIAILHPPGVRMRWNGGGRAAIWRHQVEYGKKQHPTQKPLALIRELVYQFSDEDETVFDPFTGGGTTGVACVETGRRFIGCEISRKYFEIAEARLRAAVFQPSLIDIYRSRLRVLYTDAQQAALFAADDKNYDKRGEA